MHKYATENFNTAGELWQALRPETINKKLNLENLVYRGQSDANWQLMPNASRNSTNETAKEQAKFEIQLLMKFLEHCNKVGVQVPSYKYDTIESLHKLLLGTSSDIGLWPQTRYYELLAYAQHFGVSTSLLDWSKRSFVAAYFAASGAIKDLAAEITKNEKPNLDKKLAIWILGINKISIRPEMLYQLPDESRENFPLHIFSTPSSGNMHIAAQQGYFSVFKDTTTFDSDNLNKFDKFRTMDTNFAFGENELFKWTLPYSEASRLMELCELYGVSASSVYPTSTGAGMAVNDYMNLQIIANFLNSEK